MTKITIQDTDVQMLKDTGASLSLKPTAIWKQLGSPQLTPKTSRDKKYDNHRMNLIGEFRTKVTVQNKSFQIVLPVVQSDGQFIGTGFFSIDFCCNVQPTETLRVLK